ncbi:protein translocase subunit SecD [Pseudokordiimonas caeni]|uniref:protein translocase subunit SecD n=1 Tax=Pseudokordiimonas caeni TaxID=2997908 RepID=UPI002811E084|nr:protein translocase subunit SecD [Pseudokordiimonas caeni]
MSTYPRWKLLLILGVCLFGFTAALPNFLSEQQRAELPDFLPSKTLNLGLDLRGGVHLLLEAKTDDIIEGRLENLAGQVRDIRRNEKDINFTGVRIEGRSVIFSVSDEAMIEKARVALLPLTQASAGLGGMMGATVQEVAIEREGRKFTLTLTDEGISMQARDAISRALEVVRKRVDPDGTREITLQPQGDNRIVLQVPGESDPQRLLSVISTAAKLSFHDVNTNISPDDIARGRIRSSEKVLPVRGGGEMVIEKRAIVSGDDLVDAKAAFDQNGQPAVAFAFNTSGARRFGNHTRENVGRPFAIVLDNEIISAPRIITAILGGSGQITGIGGVEEAQELATLLKAGALPVPLEVMEQRTVGPDLGADSIAAGEVAAVIGFLAVVAYMFFGYGWFGIISNIALFTNVLLILGALSLFQATLTLPGIAGIVLTIGMAVDANVIIFERIREEQMAGRKPFAALSEGYGQAMSTVIDANITTFIAAFVLYFLGSGPVQGFAVTLGIGIITSVFSAVVLTRLILTTWLNRARPEKINI